MGPLNSAKLNPPHHHQFLILHEALQQGVAKQAVEAAEALLQGALSNTQRALTLQQLGEARRALSDRSAALRAWQSSLESRYSPQVALMALETWLLPVVDWSASAEWLAVMDAMLRQGDGTTLLRALTHWLPQMPLALERQELLKVIETQTLLTHGHTADLASIWQRIKLLTNGRGEAGDG